MVLLCQKCGRLKRKNNSYTIEDTVNSILESFLRIEGRYNA